jgi:membrane fusion protein, multidrug efflux system
MQPVSKYDHKVAPEFFQDSGPRDLEMPRDKREFFMKVITRSLTLVLAVWLATILFGCQEPPKKVAVPPKVTITQPIEREVAKYLEYTGTTAALETVEIRARVAGFLDKINFEPDAKVKAGDLLFVIDPRQYQAAVKEAEGQLDSKKASHKQALLDEELAKSLQSKEAISWLKLQEATARSDATKGDTELADASLDNAKLNLEFTRVTSPISGRVSRNLVDAGNLVGATEKTLLTTVVNDEDVYCYFNVSELDLLAVKRSHPKTDPAATIRSLRIPAYLGLADEKAYPHEGHVDFTDVKLNPATGTIQVRAIFPNQDGFLMAGMFARVRVPIEKRKTLLVPDLAVQFDQGGRYVLVVNEKNVVEPSKRIKTGEQVDGMTAVEEGLTPQDRVIVLGVQRARPGTEVNPTLSSEATPSSEAKAQKKTEK